jgi:hypothetical protein
MAREPRPSPQPQVQLPMTRVASRRRNANVPSRIDPPIVTVPLEICFGVEKLSPRSWMDVSNGLKIPAWYRGSLTSKLNHLAGAAGVLPFRPATTPKRTAPIKHRPPLILKDAPCRRTRTTGGAAIPRPCRRRGIGGSRDGNGNRHQLMARQPPDGDRGAPGIGALGGATAEILRACRGAATDGRSAAKPVPAVTLSAAVPNRGVW